MPRGKVSGPDPRWAGAQQFEEDGPPAPPPIDPQATPEFLRGSGGGTPQPDPIQVTGVSRRMEIDPIQLNGPGVARIGNPGMPAGGDPETYGQPVPGFLRGAGGGAMQPDPIQVTNVPRGDVTRFANRGMPEGGDAEKYPEPPTSPQASQGIPAMLARQPEAQKARAAAKPKMAPVVAPGQAQTPSQPVTDSGSSTTPDFDAYVAQRAREIADLKSAQGTADQARRWQDIANGFVRAGDTVAGRRTDEGALQQRIENAGQPVRDVLQQQEAGRQATGDALAQTNLSGKMWEQRMATQAADPNSPISQRTQQFLASTKLFPPGAEKYVSASDFKNALEAGTAGIHSLALKAQIAHQNAELQLGKGKLDEETRNHDLEHQDRQFRMQTAVPTQTATEIESLIGSARALKDLKAAHDKAGFGDIVGNYLGVGDYNATKKAAAPEVAKGNAKGRVNPTGERRELSNLPNFGPGTGAEIDQKLQNTLRLAESKLRMAESNRREDPNHVAELRKQYSEVADGSGGSGQPATQGGHTHYLVNRAQGIRIAAGPDGKPIPGAKPEQIPDGG